MALVTSSDNRQDSRDVYVPPRERGMVHRSAISPDHKWVLLAEMDNGGWLPCRLVPFAGGSPGRPVGPAKAGCTYTAWSPDGAWMYFSSDAGGRFHIWRQRFPGGEPQQVTSGATEEEGIALAPDGRSLITSVGLVQSTIMVHDPQGDRQISSANYAEKPKFSRDGKSIFYLAPANGAAGSQFFSGELFRADAATGASEHLLPGFSLGSFAVSPDGKRVVFSAYDQTGKSRLWIAPLDLRASPRQFASQVNEDEPSFDDNGTIYFRAAEGEANFLYRMKEDGSDRTKVLPYPILESSTVSPDGRWINYLRASTSREDSTYETVSAPLDGGAPIVICHEWCDAMWGSGGKILAAHLYLRGTGKTVFIQIAPGSGAPIVPAGGIDLESDRSAIRSIRTVDSVIIPGPTAAQYAWVNISVHRNLYRIPLR